MPGASLNTFPGCHYWYFIAAIEYFAGYDPAHGAGKLGFDSHGGRHNDNLMSEKNTDPGVRTVLIVDDADVCANLLEFALVEIPGIDVVRVGSGMEALRILSDSSVRLAALVTDLNMPHVDGFELIAKVRSDARYADLPIIVVSADVDPRTPARVKRLGAEAFFAKPYSPASVRRSLLNLLEEPKNVLPH